jgi:hypothetical protein
VKEVTDFFGRERVLVGTHTYGEQSASRSSDLAVILTNAGLLDRTGPHRMNVRIARALARIGVASMRFDMSGLGDSRRPAKPFPVDEQYIADAREALDEAQARHGAKRIAMIGLCSGADVAHAVALQDERLCGLLLWDPYMYPTLKSKLVHFHNRLQELGPLEAMRRMLRNAVRTAIDRMKRGRSLAPGEGAFAIPLFGRTYIPPVAEYAGRLRRLLDRGVNITIVYTGGYPRYYNYASQYRDSFKGYDIADRISCIYLRKADHLATSRAAQQELSDIVVKWAESMRAQPQSDSIPAARP